MNCIFGVVLLILGFVLILFSAYFFYKSFKKLSGLEKLTEKDMPREWGISPQIVGGNNYREVTDKINKYIDKIIKTNKEINFSSGIVTLFSALGILISGALLIWL